MTLALLLSLLAATADPLPQPAPEAPAAEPSAEAAAEPTPAPSPAPAPTADPLVPAPAPEPPAAPAPASSGAPAAAASAPAPAAETKSDVPRSSAALTANDAAWVSRPWAIALSFVPGVVVPGLGHRLSGDARTADRLFAVSAAGAVGAGVGGGLLFLTTGNHDLSPLGMALLFAGASTFVSSWLGDVVGTLRPEGQAKAFPREDSLTAALLYGPSLAHSGSVKHLGILRAEYETPRFVLDGWGSLAPGTRYQELHLRGGVKLYGDSKRSHVALVAEGLRELGADSDSYGHGGALMVEGRFDAGLLDKSLSGLVLMQRLGGGAIVYSYDGTSATDLQAILVVDTGIALSLVDWFELSVVYTHRPDKRLGFIFDHGGHFELQVRVEVHPNVRLVALSHIGGGLDVMGGVEVAAW